MTNKNDAYPKEIYLFEFADETCWCDTDESHPDGPAVKYVREDLVKNYGIEKDLLHKFQALSAENKQLKQCIEIAIEMINQGDDAFNPALDMCCHGLLSAIAQDIGFYHKTVPEIRAQAIEEFKKKMKAV